MLGWDADWSTGSVTLLFGVANDLGASLFEGFDLSATDGHSDSLDCFLDILSLSLVFLSVHFR